MEWAQKGRKMIHRIWGYIIGQKQKFSGNRVKTPTVLQMEIAECGAASLGIIMGYFKKYVPLEELRVACGVSRDGSKASNVVKAARSYGMEARGYRSDIEDLLAMEMPVIIHWDFQHFLVLEGFKGKRVFLNDPAQGPRTVTMEDLRRSFTGIVLKIKPTPSFTQSGYKPNLFRSLKKRMLGLQEYLLFIFILGLFLLIPGMIVPAFTRIFIDDLLLAGREEWLFPLLLAMLSTAGIQMILVWLRERYLLEQETRLAIGASGKYMWHVLRLPSEFYSQRRAGDISYRVQSNNRLAMLISGDLATAFLDVLIAGFFLFLMFQYSPVLTALALFFAILNLLFLRYVARKRQDNSLRLAVEKGRLISLGMSGLQMIETLKAGGQETGFFAKWAGYHDGVKNVEQDLERSSQILMAVPQLLNSTAMALILILGGYLIIEGRLTIGMLVAFQGLLINFMAPVKKLVNLGSDLQELDADLKRLDDVEEHPLDPQCQREEVLDLSEQEAKLWGYVELKNITFGYSHLEEPLIKDFSLSLKPASRVAILGSSGSGKSTIARLLAGLYQPWSGEILFDGKKREDIPRPIMNNSLAVVDQNIHLLQGTIRENLTLWNETIPEISITQAARDAMIEESIAKKDGGYDARIAEGGRNFSGGERQRLEIARALAINPTILILDEATSALDPIVEKSIDNRIRRRGCTCIIVAHRLSTIRDCDEIIVLEKGSVVQRGTHEELMGQEDGPYKELLSNE